ncbi:MAG: CoA-binding protein [Akkermansiaceae bacterium]
MNKVSLIIGASHKEDRYSNMAQKALTQSGHTVIPFNPRGGEIDGLNVIANLSEIQQLVDTVTVYVRPAIFQTLMAKVINLMPSRIIFNPGTEDEDLERELQMEGIEVIEACTLVMLKTGQY